MKLFVDLTTRRFVKSAASSAALQTLVLKRRDLLPIEVIFVQRGAPVAAPSGTVTKVALKQAFGDANFLAVADNDKWMTPLRTRQAFLAQSSNNGIGFMAAPTAP
jgi:hypothetical protein